MKPILLTTLMFLTTITANAASIKIGSTFSVGRGIPQGTFHLISSDFDVTGGTTNGSLASYFGPVLPGELRGISGKIYDVGFGSGQVEGVNYPNLLYYTPFASGYGSFFEFNGPSFVYNGELKKILPFQFSGVLGAYARDAVDPEDCALCNVPIDGGGYAVLSFERVPGVDYLELDNVTFVFTPEPATAYLLLPAALLLFLMHAIRKWQCA